MKADRRTEPKMSIMMTRVSFQQAQAIWCTQQGLKTSAEVEEFCTDKMKRNHQKKGGEFSFGRSRLNNVKETEKGGKELLDLMTSQGLH